MKATAIARANIALAKYWGKSDDTLNLPAVPSVSLTLDPLITETTVELDPGLSEDLFELDGAPAKASEARRVIALLDEVRAAAGAKTRARVVSANRFPTAAGLASSASGFAALAGAATRAYGLDDGLDVISARARRASASAARSVYGGIVALPAGEPGDNDVCATQIATAEHWDLRVVVAITAKGRKPIGSRAAMGESRRSSPYYPSWVEHAAASTREITAALLARDFDALAPLVEQSFFAMHAVGMAGLPSVLYWQPGSVQAIRRIQALRADGVAVCATMDAGPHVKAICLANVAAQVEEALSLEPLVLDTLAARIGPGLEVRS
ncbi:MAG TPA: diphosphomevalonate decarboxylase [Polyangiaceae bacterium]|nr:diphosphomevalonate decarboxylase [Polyangiaceae bacterium]